MLPHQQRQQTQSHQAGPSSISISNSPHNESRYPPRVLLASTVPRANMNSTPHLSSPSKPPTPAQFCAPQTLPKHPGERLADFFDAFFKTVAGIATLGASLTFSKVVSAPVAPWQDYGFTADDLQYYIADAFVCFALALFITTLSASALSMWRPQAIAYFGTDDSHRRRIVMWWATLVSTTLAGLTIAAFIFFGIVIAGFTGPAGWVALGFTCFFGAIVMAVIVWQSPIGSAPPHSRHKRPRHKLERRRHQAPRYGSYHSSQGDDRPADDFVVGEYVSEEKIDVFDDGHGERYRREEEEYGFEVEEGRVSSYVDGSGYRDVRAFVDEPLSRSSTIARPTIAAVPPYTEDLRRMRQIRASDEYDGRYGN